MDDAISCLKQSLAMYLLSRCANHLFVLLGHFISCRKWPALNSPEGINVLVFFGLHLDILSVSLRPDHNNSA